MNPAGTSFVGRVDVPLMHGMTVAELASLFNARYVAGRAEAAGAPPNQTVGLVLVAMKGWTRDTPYESTGLLWVLPSPNMPSLDTVMVYPGLCLLEGTTMSEGRGTTRPFQIVGAPFLDWKFATGLRRHGAQRGYTYREAFFTPSNYYTINYYTIH
jgi:uncharacterized protein YbbC (DUF1343 family)